MQCASYTHARQASTHVTRKALAMWAGAGLGSLAFLALFAWLRSMRDSANYYELRRLRDDAGHTHRRYAAVSLLFAARLPPRLCALAADDAACLPSTSLVVIFYFSSFARGFSEEE